MSLDTSLPRILLVSPTGFGVFPTGFHGRRAGVLVGKYVVSSAFSLWGNYIKLVRTRKNAVRTRETIVYLKESRLAGSASLTHQPHAISLISCDLETALKIYASTEDIGLHNTQFEGYTCPDPYENVPGALRASSLTSATILVAGCNHWSIGEFKRTPKVGELRRWKNKQWGLYKHSEELHINLGYMTYCRTKRATLMD